MEREMEKLDRIQINSRFALGNLWLEESESQ